MVYDGGKEEDRKRGREGQGEREGKRDINNYNSYYLSLLTCHVF